MTRLFISAAVLLSALGFAVSQPNEKKIKKPVPVVHTITVASPKIQAAILLDVSGSMSGLIEQAKAQLWNMVSVMGKAKCNGESPQLEIALYEYGRPENGEKNGYIKQLTGFTTNLDDLSEKLFSLRTSGGDEYCSEVIGTAADKLTWDDNKDSYKVIFIAGNEEFNQGNVTYTQACAKAKAKGIIVNTIYCGSNMQGLKEHWNLGAECGSGSYSFINHNATVDDIRTPYDTVIISLNKQLNKTYIRYGLSGSASEKKMQAMDEVVVTQSLGVAAKRTKAKAQSNVYNNSEWDAVDAMEKDEDFYKKVDQSTLPVAFQNKSRAELKVAIEAKATERAMVQKQIAENSVKREAFISDARKNGAKANEPNLENVVERTIVEQAKRFKMIIE